jgi:hypothetical protein
MSLYPVSVLLLKVCAGMSLCVCIEGMCRYCMYEKYCHYLHVCACIGRYCMYVQECHYE